MSRSSQRRLMLLSIVAVGAAAGGCSERQSRATEYRLNPTPAEDTLAGTRDNIDNRVTMTIDTNLRQAHEDWGRLWLTDRPTRLTPKSTPY